MSYADPQSWTDVDFAGNALDWTSRKNKLLYPAYEMLRRALVERCQASDTTIPAILDDTNPVGQNELVSYNWKSTFQSTVSTLIPKFVNHTDNGGNWDGQDSIPNWTEADILATISASSRIPISYIFSEAWERQQRSILNLLRWGTKTTFPYYRRDKTSNNFALWEDVVADFISQPWSSWYLYTGSSEDVNRFGDKSFYSVYSIIKAAQNKFDFDLSSQLGSLNFTYDVYEYYINGSNQDFWSINTTMVQKYNKFKTETVETQSVAYQSVFSDTEWVDHGIPPTPTTHRWCEANVSDGRPPTTVLKFDGPNGFKFKDW